MRTPKLCRNSDGRAYATIPRSGGKRIWLGKYGTEEATLAYTRWLRRVLECNEPVQRPELTGHEGVSVAVVVSRFLSHVKATYSAEEFRNFKDAFPQFVEMFSDLAVSEFGPLKLAALQQRMVADGLARTTINARIHRVRFLFKWGVSQEIVPPSVVHGLATVPGLKKGRTRAREPRPVKPAPWSDVVTLLPWMSPVVAGMVQTQLYCGMRPSEVCRMRPCDIDRSGRIWLYRPFKHKGEWRDQECVKAIPESAQPILAPFLQRDERHFCFDPRESADWHRSRRTHATSGNRKTKRYPCELRRVEKNRAESLRKREGTTESFDRATYYRAVRYAFERAKKEGTIIPRWFPHQLRHSIATRLDSEFGRQAAQKWLGHSKLDTTAIYVEQQISDLVTLAEQVDRILRADHSPARGQPPAA